MKGLKAILLLIFLGVGNTYAQDSLLTKTRNLENISPLTSVREEIYASPALRPYYRITNYGLLAATIDHADQDLYLRQEGSGQKSLKINSESFLKDLKGTTLWGKAHYINQETKKVNYNETLDYHYVYPYVMADSVGGDLNAETYYFSGGLAKKIGGFRYGIDGSFKGIQAFRDRDPRPKNISSDIHFVVSAAKELAKGKALAVDLSLQKYTQNNSLDFINELGFPLVYHASGLGVYNELLAGSRTQAYYKGLQFGAQLNFLPTNLEGVSLQIGYHRFNLAKELSSIAEEVATVAENDGHLLIAFNRKMNSNNFLVKLKGTYSQRNGAEATFANTGQANLYKIADEVRYENEQLNINLSGIFSREIYELNFHIGLESSYQVDQERYLLPDRFMNFRHLGYGAFLLVSKPLRKTLVTAEIKMNGIQNLGSDFYLADLNPQRGTYQMLNANYAYRSANLKEISATLRVDFLLTNKLMMFSKASTSYGRFDKDHQARAAYLSAGVTF